MSATRDVLTVAYDATGASTSENAMGMRPMQARAFEKRHAQHLLLKAPPASGKSRALMFVALDKLCHQGIAKVIVAVPERSIGGSFASQRLSEKGFFADWVVPPRYDLCAVGNDASASKVERLREFLADPGAEALVCTHATLRFAFERMDVADFDACLVAVDEFHHASVSDASRLGEVVRALMARGRAHLMAMTGSYFRGDTLAVMRPEDEERFIRVTYSYFEQLNGYTHLKALGIGYHFYKGVWLDALPEVLDTDRPTILHIPSVNAAESTKDKIDEVARVLGVIGTWEGTDETTGFLLVRRPDGRVIRVADLVDDEPQKRDRVVRALRAIERRDELDLIVALGMAKEGFDWVWCEVALTVGYRSSLTEVIQIVGRATRDAPGKAEARFVNLVAEPDAGEEVVATAVNDMLKAISASLLMEQVLAPKFTFFTRDRGPEGGPAGDGAFATAEGTGEAVSAGPQASFDYDAATGTVSIGVRGLATPSATVQRILESDLTDIIATVAQDGAATRAALDPAVPSEVVAQVHLPRILATRHPDLSEAEAEQLRQHVVATMAVASGVAELGRREDPGGDPDGATRAAGRFLDLTRRFVNIRDLDIDLIDSINPFQQAYEVISRSVDAPLLGRIQSVIASTRSNMTEEEARALWPRVQRFVADEKRPPSAAAVDPLESRLGAAMEWLRAEKARRNASLAAEGAPLEA